MGTVAFTLLVASSSSAYAVPAFAEQTGQHCSTCHIGAFGPQLTPFGREFKLNGYTLRAAPLTPPVSAMAVLSFVHTNKDQAAPPAARYGVNDNATIDQISLFVAGGINEHLGAFSQYTWDGVGKGVSWDQLDFRAITRAKLDGKDVTLGLSLNNNPGVQEVWASLPAWGFPFTTSKLAPTPAAAPLFSSGTFAQNVLGLSGYAWWNSELYAEIGFYRSLSAGWLRPLGIDPTVTNLIDGLAPYFRVAYQKDFGKQNLEVGAFAFLVNQFPGRDQSASVADRLHDFGIDASYQYLEGDNIVTANARYTREEQRLSASQILGLASNSNDTLDEVVLNGSYYWQNTIGLTVAGFKTWGSKDALLYGANRTLKPDSAGYILQLDGTPFGKEGAPFGDRVNVRAGLQYVGYTQFNGASTNFDGLGRDASDNNTLRLFLWFAF